MPLPVGWAKNVKSAVLHVISLAHCAIVATRGWAANSINARVRLSSDNDQAQQEIELLREELRIKDARLAKIDPRRRPYYPATERMAILKLKAARGWSLAQAARAFFVEPDTIAAWLKRVDENGTSALVQLRDPVNKFPDFVRHIVQRLKALCPSLGKVKIAQMLARAGLHLCATTVGRMVKESPAKPPDTPSIGQVARSRRTTPSRNTSSATEAHSLGATGSSPGASGNTPARASGLSASTAAFPFSNWSSLSMRATRTGPSSN
jgi:hypothetical protein